MSDLSERAFMMQSAPFMSRPLPMMIPLSHWWEVPVYWVSAKMYDFLAGSRSAVPESHLISKVLPQSRPPSHVLPHPPHGRCCPAPGEVAPSAPNVLTVASAPASRTVAAGSAPAVSLLPRYLPAARWIFHVPGGTMLRDV